MFELYLVVKGSNKTAALHDSVAGEFHGLR